MKIKTLFISDVHLGTKKCQADKLLEVIKNYEFEKLIIVGDFIDLTSLKRKFYWHPDHSTVIQKVLRLSRKGVSVTYILGNHDFYLRELIKEDNINIGDVLLCDELYYETLKGEKIYICHGDQFDGFIRLHPFLYVLGDWAYEFSFKINKTYNWFRRIFGLEYWSLSQYLKSKVKNAIAFINDFKILSLKDSISFLLITLLKFRRLILPRREDSAENLRYSPNNLACLSNSSEIFLTSSKLFDL